MKKRLLIAVCCGSAALLAGCTTTLNLALINSRSPAVNALGTNDVDAATGMEGGGTVTPETTVTPTALP